MEKRLNSLTPIIFPKKNILFSLFNFSILPSSSIYKMKQIFLLKSFLLSAVISISAVTIITIITTR